MGIGLVISGIRRRQQFVWLFCVILAATGLADAQASVAQCEGGCPSASIVLDGSSEAFSMNRDTINVKRA